MTFALSRSPLNLINMILALNEAETMRYREDAQKDRDDTKRVNGR